MSRKIFGIILIVFAGLGMLGSTDYSESLPPFVILAIIGLWLVLKKGKTKEQKMRIKAEKIEEKQKEKNIVRCKHTTGLPLADGIDCIIQFNDDGLCIDGGGNTFNLPYDRITDMQTKSEVEIQKSYASSIGGAVGGAVLFGPLGAMIGGRAKEKTSTIIDYYLIVTYNKDDNINYLSFLTNDDYKADRLIMEKQDLFAKQNIVINL